MPAGSRTFCALAVIGTLLDLATIRPARADAAETKFESVVNAYNSLVGDYNQRNGH
ncbi:MAG TPA: hypothetical protein VGU20_14935 [Stellaceae bacterium]|nr:hypothetical protein [Stellaceae bacterium]